MVGCFLVWFWLGFCGQCMNLDMMLSTSQFSLPPHPQQWSCADPWTECLSLGCMCPAVVNNLLVVHWLVTGALLWAFMMGVFFFILQGRRELASCGSDSYPCMYSCLNLLRGMHSLKAYEAHGVQHFTSFVLCSSGDLLKVSTCWQSEERTMPVCCWWQGSASSPGASLCFSFFAVLRSWSFILKRFFWKGRNGLGNLCRSAFSF